MISSDVTLAHGGEAKTVLTGLFMISCQLVEFSSLNASTLTTSVGTTSTFDLSCGMCRVTACAPSWINTALRMIGSAVSGQFAGNEMISLTGGSLSSFTSNPTFPFPLYKLVLANEGMVKLHQCLSLQYLCY